MQQFSNSRLIHRNGRVGRILMFSGLGITIVAAALVFWDPNLVMLALIAMLIGGLFSQIGTALFNRFGREPRMDQVLDASLKGLDDRYATFHYLLGSDHVLVAPEGIFALIPRWEKGEVRYQDGSWYHTKPRGRFSLWNRERVLRGFEKEAARELKALDKSLERNLGDANELNTNAIVVFIAGDTVLDVDSAPVLAIHRKKLKDLIRSLERGKSLDREAVRRLAKNVSG